MTGLSAGRGFRRIGGEGWTAMGTGFEVRDWKEAKDWMASEGSAEGLARGAPSVEA
jgi:hypothetical protein